MEFRANEFLNKLKGACNPTGPYGNDFCHASKRGVTKRGGTHKTTKVNKTQLFSTIAGEGFPF